jgi:hypothetical protein
MAEGLGIEPVYIYGGDGLRLPVRYWRQWKQTGAMLRAKRPATVLVMQPPFFSLLRAWIYSLGSGAKLAADMHTGAFQDPTWKWATPWILRIARSGSNRVIVTNSALAARARAAGAEVLITHGYLRPFVAPVNPVFDDARLDAASQGDFVLLPLGWGYDEPIDEILEAARRTPEIQWILTGKAPQAARDAASSNVVFSGFASRADYQVLRARASVIGAITTAEDTMQRAGYEALEVHTPLVTSPMVVLKEYFGDTAVYAQPTAEGIAGAMRTALAEGETRRASMAALLTEKVAEQEKAMTAIKTWIAS